MAQPLFPKQQIANLIGEISSSLKRGYINELTAQALFTLLQKTYAQAPGSPSFSDAYRDAQAVYNIVRKLPGEQMRDIPPAAEAQIRQALRRLIRTVYSIELPDRAKAAAVVAAAKAVGTPQVKASLPLIGEAKRIATAARRVETKAENRQPVTDAELQAISKMAETLAGKVAKIPADEAGYQDVIHRKLIGITVLMRRAINEQWPEHYSGVAATSADYAATHLPRIVGR